MLIILCMAQKDISRESLKALSVLVSSSKLTFTSSDLTKTTPSSNFYRLPIFEPAYWIVGSLFLRSRSVHFYFLPPSSSYTPFIFPESNCLNQVILKMKERNCHLLVLTLGWKSFELYPLFLLVFIFLWLPTLFWDVL
jgi:hypothetical protein